MNQNELAVNAPLERWVRRLEQNNKFDLNNGTSQLGPLMCKDSESVLARAVEYGKLRALERFAEMVEEGFSFDEHREDA